MPLNLNRPLLFLDLETTGVDVCQDAVVQIATYTLKPDGTHETWETLVNPGIAIPPQSTEVHGITDEMVSAAPNFLDLAPTVLEKLRGVDLGGFNLRRFDLPLLHEELSRAGQAWDWRSSKIVDCAAIFMKMNPRNLAAFYERYTGKALVEAHNAAHDIAQTVEAFLLQVSAHEAEIGNTVEQLHEASLMDPSATPADLAGKFSRGEDGALVFNFGKHKGQKLLSEPGFCRWMLKQSFTFDTVVTMKKEMGW